MSDKELLGETGVRWSAESIRKAERLISDEKVHRDADHDDVYFVEGSGGQNYRIQTDGHTWASCTCPNGMRTSRPSCYHLAAVLMLIADREAGAPD